MKEQGSRDSHRFAVRKVWSVLRVGIHQGFISLLKKAWDFGRPAVLFLFRTIVFAATGAVEDRPLSPKNNLTNFTLIRTVLAFKGR